MTITIFLSFDHFTSLHPDFMPSAIHPFDWTLTSLEATQAYLITLEDAEQDHEADLPHLIPEVCPTCFLNFDENCPCHPWRQEEAIEAWFTAQHKKEQAERDALDAQRMEAYMNDGGVYQDYVDSIYCAVCQSFEACDCPPDGSGGRASSTSPARNPALTENRRDPSECFYHPGLSRDECLCLEVF